MICMSHFAVDGSKFGANSLDRQPYAKKEVDRDMTLVFEKMPFIDPKEDDLVFGGCKGKIAIP
jgi:hypothetical protein